MEGGGGTLGVGTKRAPPRNSILLKGRGKKICAYHAEATFPDRRPRPFVFYKRSSILVSSSDGIKFVAHLWIYIELKVKGWNVKYQYLLNFYNKHWIKILEMVFGSQYS